MCPQMKFGKSYLFYTQNKQNRYLSYTPINDFEYPSLKANSRHPTAAKTLKSLKKKTPEIINMFETFSHKNGFKFSTNKTSVIHSTKSTCPPPLELQLGNTILDKLDNLGHISLVFNPKLN